MLSKYVMCRKLLCSLKLAAEAGTHSEVVLVTEGFCFLLPFGGFVAFGGLGFLEGLPIKRHLSNGRVSHCSFCK